MTYFWLNIWGSNLHQQKYNLKILIVNDNNSYTLSYGPFLSVKSIDI